MPDLPLPQASSHERLARALAEAIDGEVRFSIHDRLLYATDASIYQVTPVGVVIPRTVEDVVRTVRFCAANGLPILPRGGGTSLAGQCVNAAVVIDMSPHLDALLAVDAEGRARVEPGIVLDDLNRALADRGLMFGPDVATSAHATLGGMIGNNSAGAHSILYGRTVEHVAGLEIVTADGERLRLERGAAERDERVARITREVADVVRPRAEAIRRRFPRTRRRVNGYNLDLVLDQIEASRPGRLDAVNLAHLVRGAEGTLGVVVEATLDLVEAPRAKGLAIVAYPGVDAALEAIAPILETGPAAVELIDDVIIELARRNLEHRRYVELLPGVADGGCGGGTGAVLYVEYFADEPRALEGSFARLEAICGAASVRRCTGAAAMADAWKLRKAGEPLLHGQPGPRRPITFVEDTAVAPSRLPEFIRRFRAIVEAHGTTASYYAHASVGCLHIRPLVDPTTAAGLRTMEAMVDEVTELVLEFGGALSGEHGDGRLRSHLLERFYGPEICAAFRAVRAIFDPEGRLNPGNITSAPPMTAQLRLNPTGTPVRVPGVTTFYRYGPEHGFGEAVERCNGAGVCRRTRGGTMCPSYRATRDERHATRGRGNALRLAITGQLGGGDDGRGDRPAWNDPETLRTLDLCLSCKACKSECPSNVDIAKLKAEYLAQSYAHAGRIPLRVRALGHVRGLNRLGVLAPAIANVVAGSGLARAVIDRGLGIDRRRSLPPFGPSLLRWFGARGRAAGGRGSGAPGPADAPVVLLHADCFTTWNEPAVGRAAVGALEALGYRVELVDAGCCGRPQISNGLLARAVATGSRTARTLATRLEATGAVAILGCEPSCVSAITDDWTDLDLDVPRSAVERVADVAALVEDWIERRWDEHPRRPALAAGPPRILLHGHCHQRALWSDDGARRLLARVPGAFVAALDTGCCGMAGAFGYTRDHFDLSMAIGELALFPALRAEPGAVIAAGGTSCRHQIRDALGRVARHPVEIVAEAMGGARAQ